MGGGENCTLSATGYGSVRVRIGEVQHGMEVLGMDDASRFRHAFYTQARISTRFSITVLLNNDWRLRHYFCGWLRAYGDRAANPNGGVGPMRVMVPSRRFDRLGILKTGVNFGDDLNTIGPVLTLDFVGGRGPEDFINPVASYFENTKYDPTAQLFYPGGIQLSAKDSEEDKLYGAPGNVRFK